MAECIKCGAYTKFEKGYCYKCYASNKYSKNNINISDSLPTEGEDYLIEFFKKYNIKAIREKEIEGLKDDTADFRKADFYLPTYDVYVEFLGQWNVDEEKKRYVEKMVVYNINQIPCVFIYPENLGIISHVFDKRLQKVLTKHDKLKELYAYKRFKFFKGEYFRLFLIIGCVAVTILANLDKPDLTLNVILLSILVYQIVAITSAFYKIFHLNKYTLDKLGD